MEEFLGLSLGILLCLALAQGGMDACYDERGRPQRCLPVFENAAFGRQAQVTNTCGSPPEEYCLQMGAPGDTQLCHRCDARHPDHSHNASYLTDFHSQEESTWWQSQSMAFGVQYPNSVNITLQLGKAYEITYVRLKFHTSRPESFAIYKRSWAGGPWVPYQYYSASCEKTYGKREDQYLRPGEDERVAFCTDEFSDISPLSGGNVAFSTLEGRPSAYSFDESPILQEWVTSTDLLISLNRLNTFGDDIFKDPKVLQSYYYAITDFSVGGRCKCNGHASECVLDEGGQLVCSCQHNTTGTDCERCLPFYQDRPWARGTAEAANECLPCNCSGLSEECFYDWELYRSTGRGGHCRNCRDHTAGPHCEYCQENFYRWDQQQPCQPCDCHPAGSLSLQCDNSGTCECKPSVTGWKCDRCLTGFHSLSEGGCRACACNGAGSLGPCDSRNGRCPCKDKVEGYLCDRCQPGTFNLQPHNPSGCTSCFCYGHSMVCAASTHYGIRYIISEFHQGAEGWQIRGPGGREKPAQWSQRGIFLEPKGEELWDFVAPEKFLGDQRFSYGQSLSLTFWVPPGGSLLPVRLKLEGAGLTLFLKPSSPTASQQPGRPEEYLLVFSLQETSEDTNLPLPAFHFQRLLANLTGLQIEITGPGGRHSTGQMILTEVQLTSAGPGLSPLAPWVEECTCPEGYMGQFCESCSLGYKRETPLGGPYASCVPCTCNQHGTCDPETGICQCLHHTEGPYCERCTSGFYGNPFLGHVDDCKPCPCPGQSACTTIPESGEVVCTHCPKGQRGRLCEICDDGFFGDPLGRSGPRQPCQRCQCNGNVDPNAVGNCNPTTGHCLRCLYNTTGAHCEQCQEGFYGSALAPHPLDKCTPCSCNSSGSTREQGACDPRTGQCSCLPHVTGRDCSHCSPGFYDLQPERGCRSCKCHPVGSQENQCHPVTGQCPCLPGVSGVACTHCQPDFFGFSAKGCRACNCSPLGSVTTQCHENSTCVCKPGFVGYKCDHCKENFFLTAEGSQCQECPICFSLVKKEATKLKATLTMMEQWLRKSDCDSPWSNYILLGESTRGDAYQGSYLLQGTREAFLEQMEELESSMRAARHQLRAASESVNCAKNSLEKTCIQLEDIEALLLSTEQEVQQASGALRTMVIPQEVPHQLTNWSHLASESQALAKSHRDIATKIEAAAQRALLASNTSYTLLWSLVEGTDAQKIQRELEDKYQEVQRAQEELRTSTAQAVKEAKSVLTSVQHVSSERARHLAKLSTPEILPLTHLARDLDRKLQDLEKTVASREQVFTRAAQDLLATSQGEFQKIQPFQQLHDGADAALSLATSSIAKTRVTVRDSKTLLTDLEEMRKTFPQPKDQASLRRKARIIQDKLIGDTQKKTKQAERMLGNAASVSATAKKKAKEAELLAKESTKHSKALLRESKQQYRQAVKLANQAQGALRDISRQVMVSKDRRKEMEKIEWVGTGLNKVERSIREARISLEMDIKTLSILLTRLGKLDPYQALASALNETEQKLEPLRQRLDGQGPLQDKLSLLEQEAEQQELQIQDLESDLKEIQADKQNLEDILHSLPEGCASWQ
ncbi:laminin subunit gamma-3 isoform X1 [Sarcophilus harrisii]|uniref:Laminin subunit gamma-3 n=1 Tax=Sarcophilus harrisii TaxID=9305 RepID=G3WWZ5_SARHA|nr:laminin subunit gamma-3 isoform X1 [Sarcophilus harrisii]